MFHHYPNFLYFGNFFNFISFSYRSGVISTLVDRAYKINNSRARFNSCVKKLYNVINKNQYFIIVFT